MAVPCVTKIRIPKINKTKTIGKIQNFFRLKRNVKNSFMNENTFNIGL